VDQILADEQVTDLATPGTILWPLTDHLGTVRDLAQYDAGTATTTIANHRVYNAFGQLITQTNAAVDHLFAFTGRAQDNSTGLQNNLNRWYDAKVGQWISQDPIGFDAADANLYRYVANAATAVRDPSGLAGFWSSFWHKTRNVIAGTTYGAAGGAATGTLTGLAAGAAVGGILGGGAGALPGAGAGGAVGLVGGTLVGAIQGAIDGWNASDNEPLQVVGGRAAEHGLWGGVPAGALGGMGAAAQSAEVLAAGQRIASGAITAAATADAGVGVGTQAVLAPGLSEGTWPALLVDGKVYAARFHNIAWDLAGRGNVQKYGMAIIDETGKVVGWMP